MADWEVADLHRFTHYESFTQLGIKKGLICFNEDISRIKL